MILCLFTAIARYVMCNKYRLLIGTRNLWGCQNYAVYKGFQKGFRLFFLSCEVLQLVKFTLKNKVILDILSNVFTLNAIYYKDMSFEKPIVVISNYDSYQTISLR